MGEDDTGIMIYFGSFTGNDLTAELLDALAEALVEGPS